MKNHVTRTLVLLLLPFTLFSQTPGLIIKPAGGAGVTPLNPNGNSFISTGASGFVSNDVTESEIPFKVMPPAVKEPTSDIQRGPNTLYSDLVQYVDGSGFYAFNDGTNLIFRLRLGSTVSGSKGYSILIDTDQKMGNTGTSADPNYVASTTMYDGNPGFEREVTLETNFRVAVYNVDGTSTPSLLSSYPIATNSQVGVALSMDSGTPDYFYDFYVPFSSLGISASTPIRLAATTVMAPQSAIGGPKSDIFGVDDQAAGNAMAAWTQLITNQVAFTANDLTTSGSGIPASRTAPPVVNNTVGSGSNVAVSGTWTSFDASKPSPATITLYKNGVAIGTTSISSGGTWNITVASVAVGDKFYATAQASGESVSVNSNTVVATGCSPASTSSTTGLAFSCLTRKGMSGTRPANAAVKIYTITSAGLTLLADDNSTTYKVTYSGNTWLYDGPSGGGADPCTSSTNDINDGTYALTATLSGYCESAQVFNCLSSSAGSAAAATPVITQSKATDTTTVISGTAPASSLVRLYKNGFQIASTTAAASGGAYQFTGLSVTTGDKLELYAQSSGTCLSSAATLMVTCTTSTPVIKTDNLGKLSTASSVITGNCYEAVGTTIKVYEAGLLIGTTSVTSGGNWSLTYTPVASKQYTATAQSSTCSVSASSTAVTALAATTLCPSISGTGYGSSSTTINGTMPSAFTGTIRLYEDGIQIGSASLSAATTWSIPVNTNYSNALYPGGVLTVTSQASGAAEKTDCSSTVTCTCTAPVAAILTTATQNINAGSPATFNIENPQANILYSISSSPANTNLGISRFGSGSSLSLSTVSLSATGTFPVVIKSTDLSGPNCESLTSASITVSSSLPLRLLSFAAARLAGVVKLTWSTDRELDVEGFDIERSTDGRIFTRIGNLPARNSFETINRYTYDDPNPSDAPVLYYRLRMIDVDGKYRYSQIQMLSHISKKPLQVIPNPFVSEFMLGTYSSNAGNAELMILAADGHQVFRKIIYLEKGTNQILVQTLSNTATGIYLLQLKKEAGLLQSIKIIRK